MPINSEKNASLVINYRVREGSNCSKQIFENYLKKKKIINYEIELIENSNAAYCRMELKQANFLLKQSLDEKNFSIRELSPKTDYAKIKSETSLLRAVSISLAGLALLVIERLALIPPIFLLSSQLIYIAMALSIFILLVLMSKPYLNKIRSNKRVGLNYMILLVVWSGWLFSVIMLLQPAFFLSIGLLPFFSLPVVTLGMLEIGNCLDEEQVNKMLKRWCDIANVKISDIISQSIFILDEKKETTIPIKLLNIKTGDSLLIKSDAVIPVDGVIIKNPFLNEENEQYILNEFSVSGESVPVKKRVGDKVRSGSVNVGEQALFITAEQNGDKSDLYLQIQDLEKIVPDKDVANNFSVLDNLSFFFIFVLTAAIVGAALLWLFFGPIPVLPYILLHCLGVLVCACPCSLALAQLLPIYTARSFLANEDILIKNDLMLGELINVNAMVFDKTCTLTDPNTMEIKSFNHKGDDKNQEIDRKEVIRLVASLEWSYIKRNAYAKTFFRFAKKEGLGDIYPVQRVINDESSKGIRGIINNQDISIGPRCFIEKVIGHKLDMKEFCGSEEGSFIAVNGCCRAQVIFTSDIRKDARLSIEKLKKRNIKIYMLTGDNAVAAKKVADELKITEFKSDMSENDKKEFIDALRQDGFYVGMVGDGKNDILAFKSANVGFAITAEADTTGAGNILLRGKLIDIPYLIDVGRKTYNKIFINVGTLLCVNMIAILIAAGILYPLLGFLIIPTVASIIGTLLSGIAVGVAWINRERLIDYLKNKFLSANNSDLLEPSIERSQTSQADALLAHRAEQVILPRVPLPDRPSLDMAPAQQILTGPR